MNVKTTRWDAAEDLDTNEDMASFLEIVMEEPSPPKVVRSALGAIARAMGIREISKRTGIDIKVLKRAFLTDDIPSPKTVANVIRGLGGKARSVVRKKSVVKTAVSVSPTVKRVKRKAS